jgi:hypothetical protein
MSNPLLKVDNWVLDTLNNKEYADRIREGMKTGDMIKSFSMDMRKYHKERKGELDSELRERMFSFKEKMREHRGQIAEGTKMLVVSHGIALKGLLSTGCTADSLYGSGLTGSVEFSNSQMESIYVDGDGTITHHNTGKEDNYQNIADPHSNKTTNTVVKAETNTAVKTEQTTNTVAKSEQPSIAHVAKRSSKRLQRILIACLIILILFFSKRLRSLFAKMFFTRK